MSVKTDPVIATAHLIQDITASLIKYGLVASIDKPVIQAAIAEVTGNSGTWSRGERVAATEALWSAIKSEKDWKLGYSREFTEAVQKLKEMDKQ